MAPQPPDVDVTDVELGRPPTSSVTAHAAPSIHDARPDLPPVDRGRQAWLFLAACVAVEMLVWGFPFAFGVLNAAYQAGPFHGASDIAAIGTTASGVLYLDAPLLFGTFQSIPRRFQRWWPLTGIFVVSTAIVASSFADTVPQLIATQGLMYALGGGLIYTPCICYVDEWFHERKGLAFGLMYAGTGIGGVLLPLSLNAALAHYSFRTVMRGYGCALFVVLLPLIWCIRPRLPASQWSPQRPNLSFLKSKTFALHQLGNILQGLGFFLPSIFLPTYVENLGGSKTLGTVSVVLFNVASVAGCVGLGYLVDVYSVVTCIFGASLGAGLSVFILWGIGNNLAIVYAFAIIYGLSAGGFSSTWPGTMRLVRKTRPQGTPTMILGFLAAGRGLGNVVSGPISDALLGGQSQVGPHPPRNGYSSAYGTMIIFTGVTAMLGGVAVLVPLYRSLVALFNSAPYGSGRRASPADEGSCKEAESRTQSTLDGASERDWRPNEESNEESTQSDVINAREGIS